MLGPRPGEAAHVRVSFQGNSKWRDLLGEDGKPERWQRGQGSSERPWGSASPDQVAVVCWPEIPSSLTEQVLDPLSPELLGAQVPSLQEANLKPALCLCPRGAGAGVPEPHEC